MPAAVGGPAARRLALVLALAVLAAVLGVIPAARAQDGSWASHLVGPRARMELRHPDADVRRAAVRRLAVRGEPRRSVTALLEALESEEDVEVREAIFRALARRGDRAAVRPLAAHLADWSRPDRAAALATLGALGGEAAIGVLVEWLGAADVGDAAVQALVEIGAPAVPRLVRALEEPVSRARAARALGRIGDARATEPLVGALQGALPAARAVVLEALGELGDERAAPAVAGMLEDPSATVVAAALGTLARIGGPALAGPVATLADRGPPDQRAAALRALATMDPAAAAPRLRDALTDEATPAVLRRAAVDGALAHPAAASVAPLLALLGSPGHRVAAAEALARIPAGGGVAPLLERARGDGERALDPALALAVRRHADFVGSSLVERAWAHLRGDPSVRGAALAALAGDADVLDRLEAGLEADDPDVRATAALGVRLLGAGARPLRDGLAPRLIEERDPDAFRALALAALALGARVDPARIDARWWDAATAPEALWLAAANLDGAADRTRSRARRAMRRSLRAAQPRVRAGAALALALARERRAWRALVAALEDEHDAVRLAAAHALWTLAVPEAAEAVAARARVEPEPRVRAVLREAARAAGRPPPAIGRGREVLYVHIATAPGLPADAASPSVDVLLPDGRWLRAPSLPGGEVLVPDLMGGRAEVQVRLELRP
jgi:HEAT repeat protein